MHLTLKVILALLVACLPAAVSARSLISDPHPTTGTQPDQCGYIEGSGAAIMAPVEAVAGGKRCNINVDTWLPGSTHTVKAFFRNVALSIDSPQSTATTLTVPTPLQAPVNIICNPVCILQ